MGSTATKILFDELLKRPNDLDLFLMMHYGFQELYEYLCVEFFGDCLLPGLRNEISKYNADHSRKLELKWPPPAGHRRDILRKFGGLAVVSKNAWPEKLCVFLESNTGGCRDFNAGVCLDSSKGDLGLMTGPFEQAFRDCFGTFTSYKKGLKSVFCDYPNRNWNSRDMFPMLVKDVLAHRQSESAPCPTANRFTVTLMALVDITDKVVQDSLSDTK